MHVLHQAALAVAIVVVLPANAAAVPILGRTLLIQGSTSGSKPARRMLFTAREAATDVGTLPDPTAGGATLRISATGGTPMTKVYGLGAAGWTAVANGFRYREPSDPGAVQVKIAKTPSGVSSLKVTIKDADIVFPPAPGDAAVVVLDIGTDRHCVSFGGAAGGTEPKDTPTLWKIKNPTAQPACPSTSASLPECFSEFAPCGTCGDGICVAHVSGAPSFVCASMSGYSAGTCASDGECTEPRECMLPSSTPPCPGGSGQCVVACGSDLVCEAELAGFCASVACIGQPCLLPCF